MKITILFTLLFSILAFSACQPASTGKMSNTGAKASSNGIKQTTVEEAKTAVDGKDVQFIDVRTEAEYAGGHAPKAVNFPLDTLEKDLSRLDKNKPVYVICQTGTRSQKGSEILLKAGFTDVYNIGGGTSAWTQAGLPIEKFENQTSKLDDRTRMALLAALADERRSEAEYEAVIAKFGDVRPFSNIVNAEKRHETFLLPLFEKYTTEVPKNEFGKGKTPTPATIAEACQNGVTGEKVNIALYKGFLEFVKEPDVRQVFEYLRDASQNNHLPAFERCGQGRGKGSGRG